MRGPGQGPAGAEPGEPQGSGAAGAGLDLNARAERLLADRRELERSRARLDEERAALHVMRTELEKGRADLNAARREFDRERFNLQWDRAALGGQRHKIETERTRVEAERARIGFTSSDSIDGRPPPWQEADDQARGEMRSRLLVGGVAAVVLLLLALMWLIPERGASLARFDGADPPAEPEEAQNKPVATGTAIESDEPALVDKPGAEDAPAPPAASPVVATPAPLPSAAKPATAAPAKPPSSPAPLAPAPPKERGKGIDALFDDF